MPKTGDQITNLDAELDALSSPTTADTYAVTKDYDPDVVAASAAKRALGGGGGGSSLQVLGPFAVAWDTPNIDGQGILLGSPLAAGTTILDMWMYVTTGFDGGGGSVSATLGVSLIASVSPYQIRGVLGIEVASDSEPGAFIISTKHPTNDAVPRPTLVTGEGAQLAMCGAYDPSRGRCGAWRRAPKPGRPSRFRSWRCRLLASLHVAVEVGGPEAEPVADPQRHDGAFAHEPVDRPPRAVHVRGGVVDRQRPGRRVDLGVVVGHGRIVDGIGAAAGLGDQTRASTRDERRRAGELERQLLAEIRTRCPEDHKRLDRFRLESFVQEHGWHRDPVLVFEAVGDTGREEPVVLRAPNPFRGVDREHGLREAASVEVDEGADRGLMVRGRVVIDTTCTAGAGDVYALVNVP